MRVSKAIFQNRKQEIDQYLSFLKDNEAHNGSNLNSIIKASIIMMIYNLIESTVNNVYETIFDYFNDDSDFSKLNVQFQKIILEYFSKQIIKYNEENRIDLLYKSVNNTLPHESISFKQYNKDMKLFSGNLDRRKIEEISKKFGVIAFRTEKGTELVKVKKDRNDLGHGSFSFIEKGRDYSITDIERIKDDVYEFLEVFIIEFEKIIIHTAIS